MDEKSKSENKEVFSRDNQDIVSILKKMQYKLDAMEEKLDSLIRVSKQQTFKKEPFAKIHRDYDKTRHQMGRRYEGKKEGVSSEGKFYQGRPFGKKKETGKSNLWTKKKSFKRSPKEDKITI